MLNAMTFENFAQVLLLLFSSSNSRSLFVSSIRTCQLQFLTRLNERDATESDMAPTRTAPRSTQRSRALHSAAHVAQHNTDVAQ